MNTDKKDKHAAYSRTDTSKLNLSDEEWIFITGMGVAALMGQYFVTKAYANDKAGIVSAIGYSNIVFALVIGIILGDPFPGLRSLIGITLVIGSGILISMRK